MPHVNAIMTIPPSGQPLVIEYEVTILAYAKYEMLRAMGLSLTQEPLGGELAGCVCVMIEHADFGEFDVFVAKGYSREFDTKLNQMLSRFDPAIYQEWLLLQNDPTDAEYGDLEEDDDSFADSL